MRRDVYDDLRGERDGLPLVEVLAFDQIIDLLVFQGITQEQLSECLRSAEIDESDGAIELAYSQYSDFAERLDACIDIANFISALYEYPPIIDNRLELKVHGPKNFCDTMSLRNYIFDEEENFIEVRLLGRHAFIDDCSCGRNQRAWMSIFKSENRWRWDDWYPDLHK